MNGLKVTFLIFLTLPLLGGAQDRSVFYNSFASFDIAPNVYISSHGRNFGFGADVAFGKWILSTAGIRLQTSVQFSGMQASIFNPPFYYTHLDLLIDPVTSINGRNRSDSFRSYAAFGVGFCSYSGDNDFCGFLALGAEWKISDDWRLFTELATYIHPSNFDDNQESSSMIMARIGLSYDILNNPTRSRSRFETKNLASDWFFEVSLGVSSFNCKGIASFDERIDLLTPIFEFSIGKRLTHTFNVRMSASGLYTRSPEELFSYYNLRGDLMFDVMAFFMPERPNFVVTARPYISAGVVARLDDQSNFLFSPAAGIQLAYRHDTHNELFLDSRYLVTPPRFAHVSTSQDILSVGLFSLVFGYKYTFSKNSFR